MHPLVERYLLLGLRLGRHVEGFVDAYYGPPALARQAAEGPRRSPAALEDDARALLADLDGDGDLPAPRRRWLLAQTGGLRTSAAKLAGAAIAYPDEVEACYGVRPRWVDEEVFAAAHRALAAALPGTGDLAERLIAWREGHAVPVDRLGAALRSLGDDLRERTSRLFGLPDGEAVEWELVGSQPWSGYNYYLGGLRSRVAINTDLPVLSLALPHLVAHEAYPGHHTEHCLKEVGLVRSRHWDEEALFVVGTPQCLLTEGLADLGLDLVLGRRPEPAVAEHFGALGVPYDAETATVVAEAAEGLTGLRGNVALLLHADGADADAAIDYLARWGLQSRARAAKAVEFLLDPLWRSYITCYVEGLPLCRRFVGGDPARFRRLLTEQLVPADLAG